MTTVVSPLTPAAPPTATQSTRPLIGVAAVLVGTIVTTLSSRVTSIGLADIRGAVGIGVDEGAWLTTSFSVAQMLIGPLAVWLARVGSNRRVLLWGAATFCVAEMLLPFSPDFACLLAAQFVAGLGSGVFIPVTIGFILMNLPPRFWALGLAVYAMNLELSLNIAATLEGWYDRYADWRWLFWQNAILAVVMIVLVAEGVPKAAWDRDETRRGDFAGMALAPAGFALLFAALDQGDRLDWLRSDLIAVLAIAGALCLAAFFIQQTFTRRPGIDLSLAVRRNMLQILLLVMLARFLITASGYLVPQFLVQVAGHRPFEFGNALLFIAIPQLAVAPLVAWLLMRLDPRVVMTTGLLVIAFAFADGARLTPDWHEGDFIASQLTQAIGQTTFLTAVIFFAVQHFKPADAMTFGAFLQIARLFGGELGTAAIQVFSRRAEEADSHALGTHVSTAVVETLDRLQALGAGLAARVQGTGASDAAVALLDRSVRVQAFTLGYADGMRLCIGVALVGLALVLTLRRPP